MFSKRSLTGSLLLIILIGEPTVGQKTGLFTPFGFILFFLLYLSIFHVFEAFIVKYKFVIFQVILFTFALYSVLVTGLLNKELTEYVLRPNPIITPIRIQASFFAAFAIYILNRFIPREVSRVMSIKQALTFFTLIVIILSFSGIWGIPSVIFALKTVPLLVFIFVGLAILALFIAFKTHPQRKTFYDEKVTKLIIFYLVLGIIPNLAVFMILLTTMIFGGIYVLLNRNLRNSPL